MRYVRSVVFRLAIASLCHLLLPANLSAQRPKWTVTFVNDEIADRAVPLASGSGLDSTSRMAIGVAMQRPLEQLRTPRQVQWGKVISQSFGFLSAQQGILFVSDKYALPSTHGKFFEGWQKALEGVQTWDDGDPIKDNYIGHPIQGAITGYIYLQNSPAQKLEFENSRLYWMSRLKATAYSFAYSAQFEVGPVSEASIRKLGSYEYRNCPTCKLTTGMGYVDFIITPTVGLAWMIGEDAADKYWVKKYEEGHGVHFMARLMRCGLSPSRVVSNLLRFKPPWYRDSRDERNEAGFAERVNRR